MVEPFSAVLVTLSTTAVRDLVAGKPPDRDSWASLAGELLRDVLEGQATTNDALARMDAKLDQLLVQDYQRSMRAALHLLEEAAPEWREPDERRRLIAEARDRLVDAVAASPGDYPRAIAEWHLALAWLLAGSVADARRALARAADAAAQAVANWDDDRRERVAQLTSELTTRRDRVVELLDQTGPRRAQSRAVARYERERRPELERASELLETIRRACSALAGVA